MDKEKDILKMLSSAESQADKLSNRALIIQPGAIGDCVLMLPLAEFIKKAFKIGTVTILGRSHYMEYFPVRSCIDSIKDLDSVDLHRLFVSHKDFELADGDSLITAFAGYRHIFTFLGQPGDDFEKNLIFTANCSNSVEVTTLALKPPADYKHHITKFYFDSISASCPDYKYRKPSARHHTRKYLKALKSDFSAGQEILNIFDIEKKQKPAVIHPGSGGVKKCWHIDNFYSLAEELLEAGESVIFLLGPAEQERFSKKTIDRLSALAPVIIENSLTQTFQILCCAGCFIGNDSGIAHIASASGIAAVVCFGQTNPDVYCPAGPKVRNLKFDESDFLKFSPEAVSRVSKAALKFLSS
jgi:heptosyltransferase-3